MAPERGRSLVTRVSDGLGRIRVVPSTDPGVLWRSAQRFVMVYAWILVVWGGGLMTEYLLTSLVWLLLSEEIKRYELVRMFYEFTRIGLGLFTIFLALVHGVIASIEQVRTLVVETDR